MKPVSPRQREYITNLLKGATPAEARAVLAYHNCGFTDTGALDLSRLDGSYGGPCSALLEDLQARNFRVGETTRRAVAPPLRGKGSGPSKAANRFRHQMATAKLEPTGEQRAVLAMYATGKNGVVEACAGSGKTQTLEFLANAARGKHIQYVAFSRPLVDEARERFPSHVTVSTAHGLAYQSHGIPFQPRLDGDRILSDHVAALLGVEPFVVTVAPVGVEPYPKKLGAGTLASHVMKALRNFCQSADPEPSPQHFETFKGIDYPDAEGKPSHSNNRLVRRHLMPFLHAAWADWQDVDGRLPYDHGGYLKAFQLAGVPLDCDLLLVDEAQDLAPVLLDIVEQQTCQTLLVGDSGQSIFGFTGAVDALARSTVTNRSTLTMSFRFGQPIDALANHVLDALGSPLRVVGNPQRESSVGPIATPACVLCRTNAGAVARMLQELDAGGRPFLAGKASRKDITAFARGALNLQAGRGTTCRDLACFTSWAEVRLFVAEDPQGEDLKLKVGLVDRFGAARILSVLQNMTPEEDATIVIGTAHGSKGLQWDTVQLAGDFPKLPLELIPEDELRLLYVAVTRARYRVDVSRVVCLADFTPAVAVA